MKKTILTGVMLLAGAALVSAFGLSIAAGGGYGLGLDGEVFGTNVAIIDGRYSDYQNYFTTVGQGIKVLGAVDIAFGDYFSVGLGGGYLLDDPWAGRLAYYFDSPSGPDLAGQPLPGNLLPDGTVEV